MGPPSGLDVMTIMKSTVTLSSMGTDMTKRRTGLGLRIVTVRKKREEFYIKVCPNLCTWALSCSYPSLQNLFSFMRVATDGWFTFNTTEFSSKQ